MSLCMLPILFQTSFKYIVFYSLIQNFPLINLTTKRLITLSTILFITTFSVNLVDSEHTFVFSVLSIMFMLIGNVCFLNFNISEALMITFIFVIINFISSSASLLLSYSSIFISSIELFIFSLICIFLYKLSYTTVFQKFINDLKLLIKPSVDLKILLIIIGLSINLTTVTNPFFVFFIQALILLYCFNFIYKELNICHLNLKIDTLKSQNFAMQNLVDNVRAFKHDYNNTLCSIGGYISLNDMTGLKDFYSRLNFDMQAVNNIQLINTNNINEPSIYNLISSKHKIMLQNNIKFEFYNSINFKTLPIPSYEFSKILGILLDNAIDASLLSKEKEISLICRCKNNNYSIILKNSYINKDVNTEKIYQKGFSTKKIKSGLGLWEVSKILENFPQISLITQKDDNYFTQSLQITSKSTSKQKKMLISSII